ncbi:DUF4393 domain-containing protein [uncultured Vagococcus sp.]|uniref:DUF4393 domain-containing protein n=1 Tax=uncultured Vagococcus sp. TaxID=189676 RepID=UPI002587E0E0|nr:DUF4393 domain-containing protein [uncultured Vagococcus sp.]
MDITPFLPLITGAIGGATSAGVFKGPIQTLEDLWYINFGYKSSDKVAQLREKQAINIEKMRNETITEAAKISPDDIQEPKLNIIGPALEASRYYIDEDELRNMFAKVIASSMDKSKENKIHPSFVEIIKQLSTLDAKILLSFNNSNSHPIGKLIEQRSNGYFIVVDNFYLHETIENYYLPDISASVSNLIRLGLIEITDQQIIESEYFMKNRTVTSFIDTLINTDKSVLNIKSKRLDVTPYGKNFIWTCTY